MFLALWPAHWSRTQRSNATLIAALLLMVLVLSLLGQFLSYFLNPLAPMPNCSPKAHSPRCT
jgi:polar amino acid transport system permease protein